MKQLDLFSGIGGFALAARWMGWETVQFVEIDSFCQKVLAKNFVGVPVHADIKTFNGKNLRGSIDIVTGGFPCQPFSNAGKRRGKDDERYLWPEMLRVIDEVRPTYIVGENVGGARGMVAEICASLERLGYTVEPTGIEANCVGADHRRFRLWFIAYPHSLGLLHGTNEVNAVDREHAFSKASPDFRTASAADGYRLRGQGVVEEQISGQSASEGRQAEFESENIFRRSRLFEPKLLRTLHGIPNGMDRIKSIGNAIAPQAAYEIFKAIERIHVGL